MVSFREDVVDYNTWRNILLSDERYLYTGLHVYPYIIEDNKFAIIYDRDVPIIGYPILSSKIHGFKTLMLYITGLPYLGFVLFDMEIFRDLDYYMNLVDFLNKHSKASQHGFVLAKNPPYFIDPRGFMWRGWFFRTEYTYISYPQRLKLDNLRETRLREYKRALKESFVIDRMEFKEYIKYYLELARIKGFYNKAGLYLINKLVKAKNMDDILVVVAKSDKGIGAGESFLIDRYQNTCYRLFPFTTEYGRKSGASTYLLYHTLVDKLYGFPYIVMLGGLEPHIARFVQDFSHELKTYYSIARFRNNMINRIGSILLNRKGFTKY